MLSNFFHVVKPREIPLPKNKVMSIPRISKLTDFSCCKLTFIYAPQFNFQCKLPRFISVILSYFSWQFISSVKLWTRFSVGEKLYLLKSRFEKQASICIDYHRAQCGIIGKKETWVIKIKSIVGTKAYFMYIKEP